MGTVICFDEYRSKRLCKSIEKIQQENIILQTQVEYHKEIYEKLEEWYALCESICDVPDYLQAFLQTKAYHKAMRLKKWFIEHAVNVYYEHIIDTLWIFISEPDGEM